MQQDDEVSFLSIEMHELYCGCIRTNANNNACAERVIAFMAIGQIFNIANAVYFWLRLKKRPTCS
jgi:hypothetical protein